MNALIRNMLGAVVLALSLASCGGGGGGDPKGALPSTTVPNPTPSLSAAPAQLSANLVVGSSIATTVRVSLANGTLPSGPLYGMVRNGGDMFSPVVELATIDASTLSVTLHTLSVQTKGRLQGSIDLYVCQDVDCLMPLAGAPLSLPYDVSVGDASLQAYAVFATAMSVHRGEALTRQQTVVVAGVDASVSWVAEPSQPWVTAVGGKGRGAGSFTLGFKTAGLAEGVQTASVAVRASNGQVGSVPVQIQVLPVSFTTSGGSPVFSAINGAAIPAQTLPLQLNNLSSKPWTVSSSAPWLQTRALGSGTPAAVSIEPDPSRGALASGSYLADLTISSAGVPDMVITTQLVLTPATLSTSSDVITLGGGMGRDLSQIGLLDLSLNTGSKAWPYALGGLPDWLSVSAPTGAVSEARSTLLLLPRPENVSVGSRSATVMVSAQVNGDALRQAVTVNVNADQRRLVASEWGVAFTSSPLGTSLSRTVSVRANFGDPVAWTASSDAGWLQVTAAGKATTVGSSLVLTADPAKAPLEATSLAKVTLHSATPGVEDAVIRVGLWRSASGLSSIKSVNLPYFQVVADKIRPYVYARSSSGVDVLNVHTGQKVGSLSGVNDSWMPMSVSADGSRLYALNQNNIVVADLDTWAQVETWTLAKPLSISGPVSPAIEAVRVNGVDVVLLNDGQAYARGRSLGKGFAFGLGGPMTVSADGGNLMDVSMRYALDFSEMSGGMLFVLPLNSANSQSRGNQRDVALAGDGHHAYAAAGGGVIPDSSGVARYHCASFDAQTGVFSGLLLAEAYPNNVEVTRDGRVMCGIQQANGAFDFRLYTADGVLIKSYKVAVAYNGALKDRQLVASADGFLVTALTDDGYISFVPIGPGP